MFWILDRRARTNSAAVGEDDILGTNALIYQAALRGDGELLLSNLSGREPEWVAEMEAVISRGLFYDRPFWGLHFQPRLQAESEIEIALNPSWNTAELSVPLEYKFEGADGLSTTVKLEQTLTYRRSQEKWLLAAPEGNFWGRRLLYEGQYLTLNYPARDQEIVERLGADLDGFIGEICSAVEDLSCSAEFRVVIRLETDALPLTQIPHKFNLPACLNLERELPTPTLIGLPIDDSGYEAIYSGYRSEIMTAAMAQLIDYDQCPCESVDDSFD